MSRLPAVRAVAIDVLGTLVDEPAAMRATLADMFPAAGAAEVESHLRHWETLVATELAKIADGARAWVDADAINTGVAAELLRREGVADEAAAAHAQKLGERLAPWPDAVEGVNLIADRLPIFGLSNATGATLDALARRTGMGWTRALSASDARAYKPSPLVYRLASDAAGVPPEEILMVAAHAWDLRAAQAVGMRTAYVTRPVGDAPRADDTFDGEFTSLAELARALG